MVVLQTPGTRCPPPAGETLGSTMLQPAPGGARRRGDPGHAQGTMSTVEQQSHLRQELGLTDLVLTQILYVVGLSWVGTAGKLGTSQI
ncbi:MAG TPA: hypothetical protein VK607_03295, partial [Kofleriaceae bacterium]|nr:hypothetical protein [Kofleriaceae bacterium]